MTGNPSPSAARTACQVRGSCLAAAALGWAVVVVLWRESVVTLTVDDSFYYLVTAANFAHGHGFAFDQLHATNGFHPLWMWALVPVARLLGDDPDVYTRSVLVAQVALTFGATYALLTGAAPRGARRGALLALALFGGFYFTKVFVNGLESALHYALLVALVRVVLEVDDAGPSPRPGALVRLAVVAVLVTMARLTSAVFAVPALIWGALRCRARGGSVAAPLGGYVVAIAAYALSNRAEFGHWLPVNAALKAERDAGPVGHRLLAALVGVGAVAATVALLGGASALRGEGPVRHLRVPIALLTGGCVSLALLDGAVRGLFVPEVWTLVPHMTLVLLLLAREPPALASAARTVSLVAALVAVDIGQWVARLAPASYAPYSEARRAGEWLRDHTPPDAIAAGWDSGIAAAFSSRRLIDLDGLINSWNFKASVLDRRGAGVLDRYLDENRVDYIVQAFDQESLPSLDGEGEAWARWPVVYRRCFDFDPALGGPRRRLAEFVLARSGAGRSVQALAQSPATLCGAL